jgi:hypothetical protein
MVDKNKVLAHLYALRAILADPSMNARTPEERVEDVIKEIESLKEE